MVADRHVRDALADRLDHARALVAHHHGRGPRPVAVHDVEVGVAHAARPDADEHLGAARRLELELLDDDGARPVEYRCFHARHRAILR